MTRPRIDRPVEPIDYLSEGLAVLGVLTGIVIPLFAYDSLPEIIPSHINSAGEVDGYSGKATIWTLPVISALMYVFLTILNKYPHHFNYSVKITEENAAQQYGMAMRMNRIIKALCCVFFAIFTYQFVTLAKNGSDEMGVASAITFVASLFGVIAYYWWESKRLKA